MSTCCRIQGQHDAMENINPPTRDLPFLAAGFLFVKYFLTITSEKYRYYQVFVGWASIINWDCKDA